MNLAETGRIGAAAERSNVTQPTLTRDIARLEERFGGLLFERLPHGVRLPTSVRIGRPPPSRFMMRAAHHPGLVCITVAHGLMSLEMQKRLFETALLLEGVEMAGRVLEIALRADRSVRFNLYPSSTA